MNENIRNKQKDCEDGEVFEQVVKSYYKDNITNESFKMIHPGTLLKDFWTAPFDRREGDLWYCYDTKGGLHVIRRFDVKTNGWIGSASIHEFGDDPDNYYLMWNGNGSQSYLIQAVAVKNLLTSFESEEQCNWIKKLPKSQDTGINLNDFDRRYPLRAKIRVDDDIERINEEA